MEYICLVPWEVLWRLSWNLGWGTWRKIICTLLQGKISRHKSYTILMNIYLYLTKLQKLITLLNKIMTLFTSIMNIEILSIVNVLFNTKWEVGGLNKKKTLYLSLKITRKLPVNHDNEPRYEKPCLTKFLCTCLTPIILSGPKYAKLSQDPC